MRGVSNGYPVQDRVEFHPTLFLPSQTKNPEGWKTLEGVSVDPIQPGTIPECRDFVNQYKDVEGFRIYGNTDYAYSYIAETWPNKVELALTSMSVWNFDIECESEYGFPEPAQANEIINAITMQDINTKRFHTFGIGPYENPRSDVTYYECLDEEDLIKLFLTKWEEFAPDIVSGWNIGFFDIPYLHNRIARLFGEKEARRLSPWKVIRQTEKTMWGKSLTKYKIAGIAVLDYYDLYQKFSGKKLESYRLDYVAEVELGIKKLDHKEYATMKEFYTKNYQKWLTYNVRDVELVGWLNDKLKLLELTVFLAYHSKVNFEDVFSPVKTWDMAIFNKLNGLKIAVPLKSFSAKNAKYAGAYVKDPIVGEHNWVLSFDLNSLYPNIIRLGNISPETILNGDRKQISVEGLLRKDYILEDLHSGRKSLMGNGQCFDAATPGFLPEMMRELYEDRVGFKKEMLANKQKLEKIAAEMKRRGL
jgi:DNA polymerase elongation subunit (family B)